MKKNSPSFGFLDTRTRIYPEITSVNKTQSTILTILIMFFGLLTSVSLLGIMYTYKLNNNTLAQEGDYYITQIMMRRFKSFKTPASSTPKTHPTILPMIIEE